MRVWVLGLWMAGTAVAAPSGLASVEVSKRMDALNGRISFALPAGVVDEGRGRSIMSAPESAQVETRLVTQLGRDRVVVMVHELFASAPADLIAAVNSFEASAGDAEQDDVAALAVEDPKLKAVETRPRQPQLEEDAAEVDTAFYALPDRTVIRASVYVNRSGLGQLDGARVLAKKILGSAKLGATPLARGGMRKMDTLSVVLPPEAALSTMRGPDFEVYRIHWIAPFGDPNRADLGIYLGFQPGMMWKQQELPVSPTTVEGKLLGRKVGWQSWTQGEEKGLEVITPVSLEKPERVVHVFITGSTQADFAASKKLAESIEVTGPQG